MNLDDFEDFHNQVFNLPRDSFSNFDILKIKSLAEYLFLINDKFPPEGLSLIEIYIGLHYSILNYDIKNPNEDFISLFDTNLKENELISDHYQQVSGRKFRHWMELASLLELLSNIEHGNRRSKRLLTKFCEEINIINIELISPLVRDKVMSINTINNPLIGNLLSYPIYINLNFNPAFAILKYIFTLGRPCSKFELSIFFGRPNFLINNQDDIINEAINIGKDFPLLFEKQIEYFFKLRNWVDANNEIYNYRASQEPHFKFNSFFILMVSVGLLKFEDNTHWLSLTELSYSMLSSGIAIEAIELVTLLDEVEKLSDNEKLHELLSINRGNIIKDLISDGSFINLINLRAANKSGKKTSKKNSESFRRDELIRDASKQIAKYDCQGCNAKTFIDTNGFNYVEAHHILEYNSKEEGPDVLQNLLVLCPNCHSKIHYARIDILNDFYRSLRERKVIKLEQFIDLHNKFDLLRSKHIDLLLQKKILNKKEATYLYELLQK